MKIILGVTGSIAAYKAVEIMRLFQKNKHQVSIVLTDSAAKFVSAITFATFAPGRVYQNMFSSLDEPIPHITLSKNNDLLLIAPATANIIGKMANGIADDLLSTLCLAFYNKVVVAPAMNTYMYAHPAVAANISKLQQRGVLIIKPESGSLACADKGKGRLPEPEAIYKFCMEVADV